MTISAEVSDCADVEACLFGNQESTDGDEDSRRAQLRTPHGIFLVTSALSAAWEVNGGASEGGDTVEGCGGGARAYIVLASQPGAAIETGLQCITVGVGVSGRWRRL